MRNARDERIHAPLESLEEESVNQYTLRGDPLSHPHLLTKSEISVRRGHGESAIVHDYSSFLSLLDSGSLDYTVRPVERSHSIVFRLHPAPYFLPASRHVHKI